MIFRILICAFLLKCSFAFSQNYTIRTKNSVINLVETLDSISDNNPGLLKNRTAIDFILKNEVRKPFIDGFFDSYFLETLPDHDGLSHDEKYSLAKRELIFIGRAINKKNLSEENCTYYKTQYEIVIDELIFSFYDIDEGDTIFLSTVAGMLGKCDTTSTNIYLGVSGTLEYDLEASHLYALSNVTYYSSCITNPEIGAEKKYKDFMDPDIYIDYRSNLHLSSMDKKDIIKAFMNKLYKPNDEE